MPIYLADESRERIDWTIFPSVAVKTNTDRGLSLLAPSQAEPDHSHAVGTSNLSEFSTIDVCVKSNTAALVLASFSKRCSRRTSTLGWGLRSQGPKNS
jgi:hypothetical protein